MAFAVNQDMVDRMRSVSALQAEAESESDVFKAAIKHLQEAGLEEVLYTPARQFGTYSERIGSYWSLTPRARPWAIVQPRNTEEVSKALKALVKTNGCQFAIRSGGHTCYPGSNNIVDGVTIDLGLMSQTEYNPETKLASIRPGGQWTGVYNTLEKLGVMVAGGREGLVGVGGLLTGGGKTYYTCRVGFACDQVVNYEVVLADGTITNANESENPDLFRVLKGGSSNFGIVTRFDMKTFPAHDVYDGIVTFPPSSGDAVIDAFIDFTKQLHVVDDAHILAMWVSMSQRDIAMLNGIPVDPAQPPDLTMVSMINMIMTQLDGVEASPSLERFMNVPNPINNTMKHTTLAKKVAGFLLPSNREDIWFSLNYKLDRRIIAKNVEVYDRLVKDIGERSPGCVIQMVLQPFPTSFGKHSTERGGNMFGLERFKDDSVLIIVAVEGSTPGFYDMAFPIFKAAVDEIEDYAKSVGGDFEFRYLNYCDGSQDPLSTYGPENIRKMKDAAAKFDPTGVFQTKVPGGFKISKVKTPE
ncbi:Uu.00g102350.m01.CDS01 [Anthostomella pinea]|uniref:Uu.00g102350.m01.CDS01 n=1 Tax=Anthostomella pinea TaxID=933095 RepID=A0AAI8VED0_9PEZI|nr:Uu.00g102350.m01.CDS01 [Anthostomella pinea]